MISLEIPEHDRWRILRDYYLLISKLWTPKNLDSAEYHPVKEFLAQEVSTWKTWCDKNGLNNAADYCERIETVLNDSFYHQTGTGMLLVLLGADFNTMKAIIQWMQTEMNAQYVSEKDLNGSTTLLNSSKLQRDVFKYDYFRKSKYEFQQFLARFFREELGVTVCPYCNRNWITSVPGKKRTKQRGGITPPHIVPQQQGIDIKPLITPQVDHYFPKVTYPYLALSLFNLVPSCPTCNNRKHEFDTAQKSQWQWYPYEHEHCGSIWFQLNLDDYLDLSALAFADLHSFHAVGHDEDILNIISSSDDPISRLELKRLYRSHIREVQKTVFRIMEYYHPYWDLLPKNDTPDEPLENALNQLRMRFDQQRKAYLLQGADWDERLKVTPLGKMKHDLGEQLLYNDWEKSDNSDSPS